MSVKACDKRNLRPPQFKPSGRLKFSRQVYSLNLRGAPLRKFITQIPRAAAKFKARDFAN
nr:hypothetical protein [uncultured Campylobacter sp.]